MGDDEERGGRRGHGALSTSSIKKLRARDMNAGIKATGVIESRREDLIIGPVSSRCPGSTGSLAGEMKGVTQKIME